MEQVPDLFFEEEAPAAARISSAFAVPRDFRTSVLAGLISDEFFVYAICLFLFNIEIVIYSLIYATQLSIAIDRVHIQNINTSVMIFTKSWGFQRRSWNRWDAALRIGTEKERIRIKHLTFYLC